MSRTELLPSPRAGKLLTIRPQKGAFARLLAIRALGAMEDASEEAVVARHFANSPVAARLVELVSRAATGIADTTTPEWAAELVGTMVAEFAGALRPLSALARLRELGATFDLAGVPMVVPTRATNSGGTGAAWVGESGAIPVLMKRIGAGQLQPYKVAGIAPFTNELRAASASQIERILQAVIAADLAELIDRTLTDTEPASELRPAGLAYGVTTIPSVDVGTDLAALWAAMAAIQAVTPTLLLDSTLLGNIWGDPAYGPQLAAGRLAGFNVITTYFMADPGTVIALDASAFASGLGVPDIAASQAAVLTMADADGVAPTQAIEADDTLGTAGEVLPDGGIKVAGGPVGAGSANIVAESMFQANATALRVVEPIGWTMTRPAVAVLSGAAW